MMRCSPPKGGRWRSASAGRNPEKDLRARYWTFLFENLRRAVDEIYQTCEVDESIVESKEAIMMLENYAKEFHALIQYININKNYEKTAPPNRPTSLAWEVRKSSPGKSFLKNVFIEKLTSTGAKRILSFDSEFPASEVMCDPKPKMKRLLESPTISVEPFPCLPATHQTIEEKGDGMADISGGSDGKNTSQSTDSKAKLSIAPSTDMKAPDASIPKVPCTKTSVGCQTVLSSKIASVQSAESSRLKTRVVRSEDKKSVSCSIESKKPLKPLESQKSLAESKKPESAAMQKGLVESKKPESAMQKSLAESKKPESATQRSESKKPESAMQKGLVESKKPESAMQRCEKKPESAIQRNISYVSSLSSRNQRERLMESAVKKPAERIAAERLRLSQKNGSMPSLNKPHSQTAPRKTASVEKIPEILKAKADEEGWEMVRGRNRCRNSPAKTKQENQAIQFAKLSQSRIGGFPYTTTKVEVVPAKDKKAKTKNETTKKSTTNGHGEESSRRKKMGRSRSVPCLSCSNLYAVSKALCISNQALSSKKKCVSSKRSSKEDDQLSHDEAFDAQCQELDDAAWKYKILEQQVVKLELSWGEQMDSLDMELRTPGRALEMHEKLSSPFRKKSLFESIRVCNEKQLKAQEQRERLLDEKAQKFKIIQRKRLEMKSLVEQRQEKQRVLMEQKLQRAEEKRNKQLQRIIRKAHDEEEKVNEIAFINSLEAQNKRHDLISKEKDHEARLHDIQEERQRKQEEKAAKEAAAESRRRVLEAERLARLSELQERRKLKDHKVEQLFLVKEKERQEIANQKARERELRLSALNAQQQSTIEELQKKIQLKQEESARRHEENMEQIRHKAFELSIRNSSNDNDDVPQPLPYERKKICTLCNVLIGSEVYLLSHLRGKKHQEAVKLYYPDPSAEELELYNLKHIVDASRDQLDPNIASDKERQRALRKRCKKLRQRMANRGQEYEAQNVKSSLNNSSLKALMLRVEKLRHHIGGLSSEEGSLLPAIERHLAEIAAIYQKTTDKVAFRSIGGMAALVALFRLLANFESCCNTFAYKKTLLQLSAMVEVVIENSPDVCNYILLSNQVGSFIDLLIQRFNNCIPDNLSCHTIRAPDLTSGRLLRILTSVFEQQTTTAPLQDLTSYIVSVGIVDKLSHFFHCVQGPAVHNEEMVAFLLDGIAFVTALIRLNTDYCGGSVSECLLGTLRVTGAVGCVSLLYSLLLHSSGEPPLPQQMETLALATLTLLNQMALLSLNAFQSLLGSEGVSLQLRHITSHLLCGASSTPLLHELILLVGYFTVLNTDNQLVIQAGQRPTVLQQLCSLPFIYFTSLSDILFPTLIACCYNNDDNKAVLQQEMTPQLLANYLEVKYLNDEETSKGSKNEKRWLFSVRFPKCHWTSAKNYFSTE